VAPTAPLREFFTVSLLLAFALAVICSSARLERALHYPPTVLATRSFKCL